MLGLAFAKLSVGFLTTRIGVSRNRTGVLSYFFMTTSFILFVYAQCRPITKLWDLFRAARKVLEATDPDRVDNYLL